MNFMKQIKKPIITALILSCIGINNLFCDAITLSAEEFIVLQEQSFLEQFKALAAAGINQITVQQIPAISLSIIPHITNNKIAQFTIAQIQAFTADQIATFTPGQISAFTADQIATFSKEEIQIFSEDQLQGLTNDQLGKIFNLLSVDQIMQLNDDQIQNFPNAQLVNMTVNQIQTFNKEQVACFTPNQIAQILTASQKTILANLTPTQTSGISIAQINGMSGNLKSIFFNILSNQTDSQNPQRTIQLQAISQGNIVTTPDLIIPTVKKKDNDPQYAAASIEKIHAPGEASLYDINKQTGLAQVNEQSEKNLKKIGKKSTWTIKKKK